MNSSLSRVFRLARHGPFKTLQAQNFRYFSQIQIKAPNPKRGVAENGLPKFKPEFKLNFDAKGRFMVYETRMRNVRILTVLFGMFAGLCVYQILYKWDSHYRITNILIVLAGSLFGFLALTGILRMRVNVGRLYLTNSGKEVEVQKILGWRTKKIAISDLKDPAEVLQDKIVSDVPVHLLFFDNQRLCFELPNTLWLDNSSPEQREADSVPPQFKHHKELFDAILARREIDLDDQ